MMSTRLAPVGRAAVEQEPLLLSHTHSTRTLVLHRPLTSLSLRSPHPAYCSSRCTAATLKPRLLKIVARAYANAAGWMSAGGRRERTPIQA
uniref:Uncharacterized protein n=1 Tax=Ascaris lumbricoides TaxID=6252 RepID=A0A0M3HUK0_ASCLU